MFVLTEIQFQVLYSLLGVALVLAIFAILVNLYAKSYGIGFKLMLKMILKSAYGFTLSAFAFTLFAFAESGANGVILTIGAWAIVMFVIMYYTKFTVRA